MSTFHLPSTHCSVVLTSDYVIVACLSTRTVLVSVHVPIYSQCRHTQLRLYWMAALQTARTWCGCGGPPLSAADQPQLGRPLKSRRFPPSLLIFTSEFKTAPDQTCFREVPPPPHPPTPGSLTNMIVPQVLQVALSLLKCPHINAKFHLNSQALRTCS
jgi:hypothetical protein